MKNNLGNPARGTDYFERKHQLDRIVENLKNDANILISAPRRVGKSSLLFRLMDKPPAGYYIIYINTETICSSDEFFKELLKEIFQENNLVSARKKLWEHIKSIPGLISGKLKSVSIAGNAVEIKESESGQYYKDFTAFLEHLPLKEGEKLVLMVDEFPVTLENIRQEHKKEAVKKFLHQHRKIRQTPELMGKVQFIYTGSIGLETTVKRMGLNAEVNDLRVLTVPPLEEAEGLSLIQQLQGALNLKLEQGQALHLLRKVGWLNIYHVKLLLDKLKDLALRKQISQVSNADVDEAFEQMVAAGGSHLEHYKSRLRKVFKGNEYKCAEQILNNLALTDQLSLAACREYADKNNVSARFEIIIETLVHDGYIAEDAAAGNYWFYSPVIKTWWRKYARKS